MIRPAKPISTDDISRMDELARTVRIDSVKMIHGAGSGNPGSTLSPVEMLVWLYDHELHIKADSPRWAERDRFILSKGQACPAYYALFAHLGWVSRNELAGFRGFGTRLATHPEYDSIDAIDMMVQAALPAALFGLGGVLVRYRPEGDLKTIAMVCCISLVVHPTISWTAATTFALDRDSFRSVVLTAAMAPGANTYIFANMYGAARRVAASSVLFSTVASVVTIWLWLLVLP